MENDKDRNSGREDHNSQANESQNVGSRNREDQQSRNTSGRNPDTSHASSEDEINMGDKNSENLERFYTRPGRTQEEEDDIQYFNKI